MSNQAPTTDRIVVIGASAGGVAPLVQLAASLSADFPAPVGIVLHVGSHRSLLPELLSAQGTLKAIHPRDETPLRPGTIYVAPPVRHMLIEGRHLRITTGPKEHHARPAIDPLFRSAALTYGAGAIGVVLTGRLDDGTAGLQAIKACGGIAIVQDPNEADEPSMPKSARENVAIDHIVRIEELGDLLMQLVEQPIPHTGRVAAAIDAEHDVSIHRGDVMKTLDHIGHPSSFACPDCSGVLWELKNAEPRRFRCHTGHAFTLRTLVHTHSLTTEDALWTAFRALQERAKLLDAAAIASKDKDEAAARRFRHDAEAATDRAADLKRTIQTFRDGEDG